MSRLSSAPEPPKAAPTLRLSLRIGLSLAIVLMVLGTSTVLCGAFLVHLQDTMRTNMRARLRDIAALASMSVDEGQHRHVRSRADEGKPSYVAVQGRLQEVVRKVPELRYVYTMKRTEDRVIRFWVDGETDLKIAAHVGDPIHELTPTMHLAFDEPDKMYTEPNFYSDRWGTWLTGYAPVLNGEGKVECVVGVDIAATRIAAAERSAMMMLAPIAGLITTIVALFGVLLSRRIIRPLAQLETDMLRVRQLDLSPSPDIRSRIIELNRMRDTLVKETRPHSADPEPN
jgi:two-component system, sensor histidine kinase and response regulator